MKKIAIISNLKVLLIFLLLNSEKLEKIFWIFDDKIEIRNKTIKSFKVERNEGLFDLVKKTIKYYFCFKILSIKHNLKNLTVYCFDHIIGAKFFLKRYEFILLEDGTQNYDKNTYKRSLKNRLFSIPAFGVYKNVKKIYLTGLAPIPKEIKDKVEIINLKELWNKKSDKEKEEVLNIFGFNNEIINNLKGKNKILYTQPLSEDGIISENEKIKLYRQIVKNYDEKELIIKKHPREKTDYKTIFIKAEVLNQSFPAELFDLLDIKFKKAITIFSTAVLSDKEIEIDFYGTEIHPKLIGRFGSMENVMKRNAYLDGDLNE